MAHPSQQLEALMQEEVQDEHDLRPVHISRDEAKTLNILQGGQSVDEQTGLREYGKISPMTKMPEMQEIIKALGSVHGDAKQLGPEINQMAHTPLPGEDEPLEPIPSDEDPDIQAIAQAGEGKDKILALFPEDLIELIGEAQGTYNENSVTGFPQFGFLDEMARIGGTVIGGFVGGPIGAGIGNMLGRAVSGQKLGKDMAIAGLKNAGYAWAAGSGLNALGHSFGSLGANAGTGSSIFPGLSQGTSASQAAPIINGRTGAAYQMGPTSNVAKNLAENSQNVAQNGVSNSLPGFSNMGQYMLPSAMLAGSAYFGHKAEKEKEKEEMRRWREEQENRERHRRATIALHGSTAGLDTRLPYKKGGSIKPATKRQQTGNKLATNASDSLKKYRTGGSVTGVEIKGKGTGQSDEIDKMVPRNAWIWDATTVAHFGDGSTKAGQKVLKEFETDVSKKLVPVYKEKIKKEIKQQPLVGVACALSDGERETKPHIVAALGKGSFDKGAQALKKLTTELRKHKASKGLSLPPAAHKPHVYYNKVKA